MKFITARRGRRGFTLTELLVTIVIIAVIAALSFTGFQRIRVSADRAVATSNIRQLQLANTNYASDHNGNYVPRITNDPDNPGSGNRFTNKDWHQNPVFMSYFIGVSVEDASKPFTNVPHSALDPVVVRKKKRLWNRVFASYGYNQEFMPTKPNGEVGFRTSQITDPARTAAFTTATDFNLRYASRYLWLNNQEEGKSTDGKMSFRHGGLAVVTYYDGSSGTITIEDLRRFDKNGGRNHPFWKGDF